jgi:hypothetical protein
MGVIELEVFGLYVIVWEEEAGSGCVALCDERGEELMDGKWTFVVLF